MESQDNFIRKLLEKSTILAYFAILPLLLACVLTFVMGAIKTWKTGVLLWESGGQDALLLVYLIQIMDIFLVGTALFVFAVSLYALFIGPLDLPDWMMARDLHQLKVKLGSVLILFMAGVFIERLVQNKNALDLLFLAGAVAVVSFALLALGNVRAKD